jgi:superkiller protein 3
MSDSDSTTRKASRVKRLLLLLVVLAVIWGAATIIRKMLPPAPLILARESLEVGEFDLAIEHYRRHLAKYPDDWGVRSELGLVLSEVDLPQALTEFRKVPADSEAYLDARRQIVGICLASERFDEAEQTLLEMTELAPEDWWPQLTLAELHFRQRRPGAALPYAEKSSKLNPEHAGGHYLTAEILDDLQRPAEMIDPLLRVLDLELDNYAAHINLSYAYSEAGQAKRCQEEAEWCLARNPNDINAYRFLALSMRDQGNRGEAMETIQQALTLAPYDLECRLVEGELLLFDRREEDALKNLEPLYERYQNDRRLVSLLARAAASSGRTEEAKRYREQVQKLTDR